MLKLAFCLHRASHLTREEFQEYWRSRHAELVRRHKKTLRIARYVQTHSLPAGENEALRAGRGAPEEFDGIAEIWWESTEDLEAAMGSPEGMAAGVELLEDEKTFIDLSRSPIWLSTEHEVF